MTSFKTIRFWDQKGKLHLEETYWMSSYGDISIQVPYIPLGDDGEDKLILHARAMIDACHPRLRRAVREIMFPTRYVDPDGEEGGENPSGVLACAYPDKSIAFWPDPLRSLSLLTFEHEAAHCAGTDNGVPAELAERWEKARAKDAKLYASRRRWWLRKINPAPGQGYVSFENESVRRYFNPASGWISSYAEGQPTEEQRLCEDWTESVSFFRWAQRQGRLFQRKDNNKKVRFHALAPHRAKLIREWLRDRPRRKYRLSLKRRCLDFGHLHIIWVRADHEERAEGRVRVWNRHTLSRRFYGRGRSASSLPAVSA